VLPWSAASWRISGGKPIWPRPRALESRLRITDKNVADFAKNGDFQQYRLFAAIRCNSHQTPPWAAGGIRHEGRRAVVRCAAKTEGSDELREDGIQTTRTKDWPSLRITRQKDDSAGRGTGTMSST